MSKQSDSLKMPPPATTVVAVNPSIHRKPNIGLKLHEFIELMKNPDHLSAAANYLYQSLVDDAVLGVFLDVHHSTKTGSFEAIRGNVEGDEEESPKYQIVDLPNLDVFGVSTAKKAIDCNCPHCDRLVAAARFAPHLEKCMGMGRNSSRIASRRLASAKEGVSNYFQSSIASDDEEDTDWSSEKRKKKVSSNSRVNGGKKK